jgi:hypothetical protein
MEEEFARYVCRDCGGPAHPASGCQYTVGWIVCGPCVRRAWAWIMQFQAGKGRRRGVSFYDHVNVISPPISVQAPDAG